MPKLNLKKGSMEAKNFMAKLRAMRGPKNKNKAKGEGVLGDAWDYVKKGATYIKDNKLLSKGLSAASLVSSPTYKPVLGAASGLAASIGLGNKSKKNKMQMIM